mgnify:CR=1 FL=1
MNHFKKEKGRTPTTINIVFLQDKTRTKSISENYMMEIPGQYLRKSY